ncbi:hypothetical protein F4780DRAFT_763986 [Xylariomycetidae sp. FL0641]|nr:hypothetical protein F4780DRAFT_763986 [Xylariomycetidae sp. FL0641]
MSSNNPQGRKLSSGLSAANKTEPADEEQIQQALKHLNLLHVKCRGLRTTIPRMFEPPPTAAYQSEDAYEATLKSISAANNELKDFATLYTNEQSKKVLEQARKSREANPMGIRPWRAKDHPNWMDIDQ